MPEQQQHRNTAQLQQIYDINKNVFEQNERIKNIHKTALQTQITTNNIGLQLNKQRGVIQKNIELNKQIKVQIKIADKKTRQMVWRNICTKLILWVVVVVLFFANIGLVIWKASK